MASKNSLIYSASRGEVNVTQLEGRDAKTSNSLLVRRKNLRLDPSFSGRSYDLAMPQWPCLEEMEPGFAQEDHWVWQPSLSQCGRYTNAWMGYRLEVGSVVQVLNCWLPIGISFESRRQVRRYGINENGIWGTWLPLVFVLRVESLWLSRKRHQT